MIAQSFSTRDLPRHGQREAWRAWFDPVFGLRSSQDDISTGFEAESELQSAGGIMLGRVRAPRLHSIRSATHIRRSPLDHWVIALGRRDTSIVLPRTSLSIPGGAPFLLSLGEPLESERAADERLHIYLPRDDLVASAALMDRARGQAIWGPAGRLLADYMHLVFRTAPDLTEEDRARLAVAVHAMVVACVAPSAARIEAAGEQIDVTRLQRIRRVVRANLHRARLSPRMICQVLGISRSQLYRLLESEGGVARYIQRHRLQASYEALTEPEERRSIAEIAAVCGFADPSTFSRAFRKEFGISPSDAREATRAGVGLIIAGKPAMRAEGRTLYASLRAY